VFSTPIVTKGEEVCVGAREEKKKRKLSLYTDRVKRGEGGNRPVLIRRRRRKRKKKKRGESSCFLSQSNDEQEWKREVGVSIWHRVNTRERGKKEENSANTASGILSARRETEG